MPNLVTRKKDVVWNYLGTILSMGSSFLLLPFLLYYLPGDELGLWYVFVAISNFSLLFDLGFTPTLSRNIVYCMSGARRLTPEGCDFDSVKEGVDWSLLHAVFQTTKTIYAFIAVIAIVFVASFGSVYISYITNAMTGYSQWAAWAIICAGVFLNLYYLRYITCLRGLGDIAAENKAKTYSRGIQLFLSIVLLMCGGGVIGAAVGYFAGGISLRVFAYYYLSRHTEVVRQIKTATRASSSKQVREIFQIVYHIAWRDGVVQLSSYLCSQATVVLCSIFLGLGETGIYSVMLQLATAIGYISSAFAKTYLPMYQSAYAREDITSKCEIIEKGIVVFWVLGFICVIGMVFVVLPLLGIVRPNMQSDPVLLLALSAYMLLWNNHSLFCCFIVSTNSIPYMKAYILSSLAGIIISIAFISILNLGVWGLVIGQALPQLLYNNWKWPHYVMKELKSSYAREFIAGIQWWRDRLFHSHNT